MRCVKRQGYVCSALERAVAGRHVAAVVIAVPDAQRNMVEASSIFVIRLLDQRGAALGARVAAAAVVAAEAGLEHVIL